MDICKIKLPGVYRIQNIINEKNYIGSTVNLCRRSRNHRSKLERNKHSNPHLQKSWRKYGG